MQVEVVKYISELEVEQEMIKKENKKIYKKMRRGEL